MSALQIGLFASTLVVYTVTAVCYLVSIFRDSRAVLTWAGRLLSGAVVLHVSFLACDIRLRGDFGLTDIYETLSFVSLLTVVLFLIVKHKYRIEVLGAFIVPWTLIFFLSAGLRSAKVSAPAEVHSLVLPVHIAANILGVVAFGLGFAAALAYLIQESRLRHKRLDGVTQRLPALDVLDRLSFRAVLLGFPLFTIGIASGTLWALRLSPQAPPIAPIQMPGIVAWLCFAFVLGLRVAAGWRGRRAAWGTVFGFFCAVAVLVGYLWRASGSPQ